MTPWAAPLPVVALLGRCPRCGRGPLFSGLLRFRDNCALCGLDLRAQDAGDGPAVAGILVVGTITVVAALVVDVKYAPPLWLHALLWPALVLPLSIWVMRVAKAALAGLHYRHNPEPG
ncbi:DUF983 domain-containing protein [Siccirubricoccus sp. G192]|uniref:DUF983 domain-containing protein n=1 Tax=Siccirubricoccus sp. G192 TaxID=2849651 RepID=UPI001C2C79B9|nr:DUF983 domain-containing protein [Siccirubricoccus sp. G192]MBV1796312.1 DUF983 domain-containing protein [Siccirubricoccus sp. G192]